MATHLDRLARATGPSMVLVGCVSLMISMALSLGGRLPQPAAGDEFSYLLAADTFARGRLSNPTHPMWAHFESAHIIHQPTYASKFPPAQGIVLAFGQLVFGHPIVGVWLSASLACAALCWMLNGWLPPRWALLGGCLAALQPSLVAWSQNYWGGAVAVSGGALLLGATRRIVRQPRTGDAIALAAGMAILANSRPFEGLVLTLLTGAAMLVWIVGRTGPELRVLFRRVILPAAVVLLPASGGMAYYHWRVTGSALRPPYLVYQARYDVAPKFLWQRLNEAAVYGHDAIRDYHRWETDSFLQQRSLSGLRSVTSYKLNQIHLAVLPAATLADKAYRVSPRILPLLTLSLSVAFLYVVRRRRWMRIAALIHLGFVAVLLLETFMFAHYAAPATGLGFLLALQATRYLRVWRWRGVPLGSFAAYAVLTLFFLVSLRSVVLRYSSTAAGGWAYERARILDELRQGGGRHLVVVRYGSMHSPHAEWVYNDADIDKSQVVWAHELGPDRHDLLVNYFKERRLWLLEADARSPTLVRYPVGSARSATSGP